MIELAGSRGSQREDGLDRFWRNARVHTLHDASRWKYYFIANYLLEWCTSATQRDIVMTLSSQNNKPKQIILNAFDMNSVGHINHGLWTHPRDESHRFNELSYWTDLAQTLEQGLFDGLFIADITGVYDVYQNGLDLTLKESIQLPSHDPSTLVSAMAAVTQHLGFGVTVNLSYESPYQFARRFASLDHLTQRSYWVGTLSRVT